MAGHRIQEFFGDDLEETFDSLMAAPGAFGNIGVAAIKQVRPIDAAAFALVVFGWLWILGGYVAAGKHQPGLLALAFLPTLLWFTAGVIGGLIFHIAAIGMRSLAYWESYVLILILSVFGVVSLRIALDPRGRRVYRATPAGRDL
ncbi:MAG TPA: hypothetical protein VFX19_03900 [Dehalococcoidia bacterium]|jgi:hypothetical protein|nr:hypothetical protein [Dehalococcoidia bacterium]